MPGSDWDYFMENFFGDSYMMWHDGINPAAARYLKGEERDKAEEMLIQSMKDGSYWAPMGLREMRSQAAVPVMKEFLVRVGGRSTIEIAHALNVIEKTTEFIPYILGVLKNAGFWSDRMDAARLLRNYDTLEVIEALYDSISDADYLVRNHTCESLLQIHGLPESISTHKEIFQEITVDYDSNDEASITNAKEHYRRAAQMLSELIRKETAK
ncbi:MAG: HEAT repeat domain-containing protein [Candidatus Thorarchaeota archaeon]|nr:HEAT repeat domain-containing protein [Candidatus Thorarchaeota archaeon]